MKLYVIEEKIDNKWIPAIGGGSSTRGYIRAFQDYNKAVKAMNRLSYIRNYDLISNNTPRRISIYFRNGAIYG